MPYYAWKGVTLTGNTCRGTLCARSEHDLDKQLFTRDIALVSTRQKTMWPWYRMKATAHFKIQFFRQLATLLSSGIFLSEALGLMSQYVHNKPRLQEIIILIIDQVEQGIPLSVALAGYPHVFDKLIVQMAHVGDNTGTLAQAFNALCNNLEMKRDIRARIRTAALLPSITFLFFLGIAVTLLVLIVPRFTAIFFMYGTELPWATQQLLLISKCVRSLQCIVVLLSGIACILFVRWYARSTQGKPHIDRILFNAPIVGSIVRRYTLANALGCVSMLISRNMPLANAVHTVAHMTDNAVLQKQLLYIEQHITAGASLSRAMQQLHTSIFDQELIVAVRLGEESAQVACVLERAAHLYYQEVKHDLVHMTTLLNPCLTILLGLMITALIIAVYVPILSMSHLVGH